MRKVLIFYAAYGGGHLSAARSIKDYIDLNYSDIETSLVDCIKYINKALDKFTTGAYRQMAKKAPWAWGKVYYNSQKGALSKLSIISNKIMARKLFKLICDYKPDLVISTHPFSSQMCSYLKRKGRLDSKIATIMTDFAPHKQWLIGSDFIDYFFVSHQGMKNDLISKGIDSNKIFATGIPLSNKFLKHYSKSDILDYFGLLPNKKTVLFFGGGEFGLGKSNTYKVLKSFIENIDNIQIVAIAGKNLKMKKDFQNLVDYNNRNDSVKVLEYTDKVPELMSISDLVVTKPGGLTTTESLASGLPIVVINPIPGQEEENAEFLESHNVAIWIKKDDDVKNILINLFSSSEKMQKMKINARLLAKKNSTKDICKILLD